jgi:adenylate cyclase
MPDPTPGHENEEFWRNFLTRGDSNERRVRGIFRRIPRGPRCKLCAVPFEGIGVPLMRVLGKRRAVQNPSVCSSCFDFMLHHHGGATIDVSVVFADIRGSTTMAETMTPAAFRDLLDRFYTVAAGAVFGHDGNVDKFVGDELMALFFPLLSGDRHAERAVAGAVAVLAATGHGDPSGPWVPVGAGVHSGAAWVGSVGDDTHAELTAVGDVVNTAARIAAAAAAGEVLVSADAARAAGLDPALPRSSLELKGKGAPTEVVRLRVGSPAPV